MTFAAFATLGQRLLNANTLTSSQFSRVELGQRPARIHGKASGTRTVGHILIRTSVKIVRKYLCVLASFAKVGICSFALRLLTKAGAPCYIGGCTVTFLVSFCVLCLFTQMRGLFAWFRVIFPTLYFSTSLLPPQSPTPHILKWSSRLLEIE